MKTVEIKVEQGILRGEDTESKLIFKGVPYAKPPIGNLRFSSPQAPDRWLGVRDALEYSRICPQPKASNPFYRKEFYNYEQYPYPEMSEDCLYLNIWAPNRKSDIQSQFGSMVVLLIMGMEMKFRLMEKRLYRMM